jgi:hypothetical protein
VLHARPIPHCVMHSMCGVHNQRIPSYRAMLMSALHDISCSRLQALHIPVSEVGPLTATGATGSAFSGLAHPFQTKPRFVPLSALLRFERLRVPRPCACD